MDSLAPPIDTSTPAEQRFSVEKRPNKAEETDAVYVVKATNEKAVASAQKPDASEFERVSAKLLSERKTLLHKLAQ